MSKRKNTTVPSGARKPKAPPATKLKVVPAHDDDPAPEHMAALRALGPGAFTAAVTIDAICTKHPARREAIGDVLARWLKSAREAGHSAALLDFAVNTVAWPHKEGDFHNRVLDMVPPLFLDPLIKEHELDWDDPIQCMAYGALRLMAGSGRTDFEDAWLEHAANFVIGVAHAHPAAKAIAALLADLEPFMADAWGGVAQPEANHAAV